MKTKDFMMVAIDEMQKAQAKLEIPVGAVITYKDKVIARAHNLKETHHQPTHHAEILAIEKACRKIHDWRLDECEMYVTLEPCPMCAGAIMNARIKKLHIAVLDEKYGAVISNYQICDDNRIGPKVEIIHDKNYQNIITEKIQIFFKNIRKNKNMN